VEKSQPGTCGHEGRAAPSSGAVAMESCAGVRHSAGNPDTARPRYEGARAEAERHDGDIVRHSDNLFERGREACEVFRRRGDLRGLHCQIRLCMATPKNNQRETCIFSSRSTYPLMRTVVDFFRNDATLHGRMTRSTAIRDHEVGANRGRQARSAVVAENEWVACFMVILSGIGQCRRGKVVIMRNSALTLPPFPGAR